MMDIDMSKRKSLSLRLPISKVSVHWRVPAKHKQPDLHLTTDSAAKPPT